MKRLRTLLAVAAAVAGVGLASPATAPACSDGSHCYGIAEWSTNVSHGFKGVDGYVESDCLDVADPSSQLIDNEMWLNDPSYRYWVEAGITKGYGQDGATFRRFFWAVKKPGAYIEHFSLAQPALGQAYYAKVRFAGGTSWNADSGPLDGTTDNTFAAPGTVLQAGLEDGSPSGTESGYVKSLGFWDVSGLHYLGWSQPNTAAPYVVTDPPVTASWVNRPQQVQHAVGACPARHPRPARSDPGPPGTVTRVAADLLTTRAAALDRVVPSQSIPGPARRVRLRVLRGRFTLRGAPRPRGASPPRGSEYFEVTDTATGQVLDRGVRGPLR